MGPRRRQVSGAKAQPAELDEATQYIAQESLQSAIDVLESLLDAAESLAVLPDRGRTVPERDEPRVRELLVDPYRLIYSADDSKVVILGVLHQRRDFDRWGSTGSATDSL